jgi:hypothetical protein
MGWPADVESVSNRLATDTRMTRPLRKRHSLVPKFDHAIVAAIVLLLTLTSPPAVARLIIFSVVGTVNGHPLSARPHVRHESGKIIPPAGANSYAAPAISSPLGIFWIFAALDDHLPHAVLRRVAGTMGRVFVNAHSAVDINIEAAAGFGLPAFQDAGPDKAVIATLTNTLPLWNASPVVLISTDYCPSIESSAFQVFKFWHVLRYAIADIAVKV